MNKKLRKNIEKYLSTEEKFCPYCLKGKEELYYGPQYRVERNDITDTANERVQIMHCLWCKAVWDEYLKDGELEKIDLRVKGIMK